MTAARHPPLDWPITRHRGDAATLHALVPPEPFTRAVWIMALTNDALVLGSTQTPAIVAPGGRPAGRLDVVRRRSGGGAVLLGPEGSLWVDVLVPRGDPLWVDDVGRSFDWIGAAWVEALDALALGGGELAVHPGPMRRTAASDLVCFAGLGPGEVIAGTRKVVGLSQRRTRAGARFQCLAYLQAAHPVEEIVDLLAVPGDAGERAALRAQLAGSVASLAVTADALTDAFVAALPR